MPNDLNAFMRTVVECPAPSGESRKSGRRQLLGEPVGSSLVRILRPSDLVWLGHAVADPALVEDVVRAGCVIAQLAAARVLVQTGKRIGDNGIWRIAKLNGILYLLDVGSKTTSFSSAFAGIFASN